MNSMFVWKQTVFSQHTGSIWGKEVKISVISGLGSIQNFSPARDGVDRQIYDTSITDEISRCVLIYDLSFILCHVPGLLF